MATAIQRRRGTATQHGSFTGLAGEITIDTTNNTVVVHDGSTAGGHRLAKYTEITALGEGDITGIVAGAGLTGDATSGDATLAVGAGTYMTVNANDVAVDATSANTASKVVARDGSGNFAAGTITASTLTDGTLSATSGSLSGVLNITAGGTLQGAQVTAGILTASGAVQFGSLTDTGESITVTKFVDQSDGIGNNDNDTTLPTSAAVKDYVDNRPGDIAGVTAGSGISGGGTSGTVSVAVNHEAFSGNLIPSSNNTFQLGSATHVWKDVFVGPGSLYVNGQQVLSDNSGTIQVSADNNQNISVLTTGSGDVELTAGGSIQLKSDVVLSAGKTISQVGGLVQASNINMNSNSINNLDDPVAAQDGATKAYVDAQILTKDNTDEITEGSNNLYYTNARADARITAALIDEDNMASNSATRLPSQQSVKAYVDGQTTDEIAEGGSLYHTAARARAAVSVTDAGGDGSLAYNSTSGVITYTGPSASEVRAHVSAGDGLDVSSGAFSVDNTVVRTTGAQTIAGAKTFSNDAIFNGNLTVNGTQTTVNTETLTVDDNLIVLNNNESGTPSEDAGIEIERGTSTNVKFVWDEGSDEWQFTNDGSTYNTLLTAGQIRGLLSVGGGMDYNSATGLFGLDSTTVRTTATQTMTNKTLTSPVLNTGVSGTAIVDEDNMASDSNTKIPTQQSVKAYVDAQVATKDSLGELSGDTDNVTEGSTNLYFTNARADARITNALIDEDDMSSNSATKLPSQQSVKAYVDAQVDTADHLSELGGNTDDVSEGSSNLYHTTARVDARIANAIKDEDNMASNSATHVASQQSTKAYVDAQLATKDALSELSGDTDDITEGSTNLFHTTARARAAVSGTFVSGDGAFSYNSSTGVFSMTGPTAAETRAHFSAGTGINLSSGAISTNDGAIDIHALSGYVANEHIDHSGVNLTAGAGLTGGGDITASRSFVVGQGDGISVGADAVAVDSSVVRTTGAQSIGGAKTFSDDAIFSGNITINGTQTVINTETLTVDDNIIVLNNNESGTPSEDAGIEVERGSSTNVKLQWDESADVWQFTNDGSTYFSIPTTANIRSGISVTDAGGDGSLAYNSGTGVITYTGPSTSEVAAHLSVTDAGGDGALSYNNSTGAFTYTGPSPAEVRAHLSASDNGGDGSFSYDNSTGVMSYTGPSAGETRAHISVTDAGGDGALAYNNSTGVITYTGPSASETRAHFSGGTGITLSGGEFSVTAGSIGATQLASTTVSAGTYADADSVAQFTVDADGRITGASNIDIAISAGAVSGLASSATTDTTSASNISSGTLNSARLPDLDVGDFADAAVQTSGESFGDNDTSFMTSAAIQDKIQSFGYVTSDTNTTYTAGTGISLSGTTFNVGGLTVSEFNAGTIQTGGESFSDSDTVLMTAAAVQDKILSYGYTTTTGDITGVTAGSGLSGGGSSGGVTVNVDLSDTGIFTSTNTASKAVVRDGSGNFAAGTITATATQAQYADLAEKYETDAEYEPGTVVMIGGDKEATACDQEGTHKVLGVISTDPAYMMNSEAEGQYVALTGRVPCKVVGKVEKGDIMVASEESGCAAVNNSAKPGTILGKALGEWPEGEGSGIIEVLVSLM